MIAACVFVQDKMKSHSNEYYTSIGNSYIDAKSI